MDFEYTPEEQSFREEVRTFLKDNLPAPKERGPDFLKDWLTKVREKRWVGFAWPVDVGGGGGGLIEQSILKEEMALAKAPPLGTDMMGLAWVGPGIIQYGTDEQKQRFIPYILNSEGTFCTGYSEPNYGSDLASIQTALAWGTVTASFVIESFGLDKLASIDRSDIDERMRQFQSIARVG